MRVGDPCRTCLGNITCPGTGIYSITEEINLGFPLRTVVSEEGIAENKQWRAIRRHRQLRLTYLLTRLLMVLLINYKNYELLGLLSSLHEF